MLTYLNSLPAEQSLAANHDHEGLQSVQEKVKEVRKGSLEHASEMGNRVLQTLSTLTPAPLLRLCEAAAVAGPEKWGSAWVWGERWGERGCGGWLSFLSSTELDLWVGGGW